MKGLLGASGKQAAQREALFFLLFTLFLFFPSCGEDLGGAGGTAGDSSPGRPEDTGTFVGIVEETLEGGGYVYVLVKTSSGEVWVAGPKTPLEKGERVAFLRGVPMENFHSRSLGRDFPQVFFVSRFRRVERRAGGRATGDKGKTGGAGKGENPILTVARVLTEGEGLAGKEVWVRGKVAKVNAGIMGKNWVHLQDPGAGPDSPDLVATTRDPVRAGEIVIVQGILHLDKDFGYGYRFDVILEDAKVRNGGM